jgi:hypothetical protein
MIASPKGVAVAENDKFERSLTKFWKKPYRLACAGTADPAVADSIINSVRLTLATEADCRAICEMADLLHEVSGHPADDKQSLIFPNWDYRFEYLEVRLDQLTKDHEAYPCTRIAADAALLAFSRLEGCEPTAQEVRDCLAEALTERLVDHRWTSRVREGVMKERSRTADDQRRWEAGLAEMLRPQGRALFNTIYREERVPKRSPVRLNQPAPFGLERLLAPLPIIRRDRHD